METASKDCPPNVHFWIWANFAPVKLTLAPGQKLHWVENMPVIGERNFVSWFYNPEGFVQENVINDLVGDGLGPSAIWHIDRFEIGQAAECEDDDSPGIRYPFWTNIAQGGAR